MMPTPTAARLQNVFYGVTDMKRSRQFYEAVLGASLKFADGQRWAQYDAGGALFALGGPGEAHPAMTGAAAVFEVEHLESYEASVIESGGTVLARRDMGAHGTVLIVGDPDGNVLHLWSRQTLVTAGE